MKKVFLFTFCFFTLWSNTLAQQSKTNPKIDSLLKVTKARNDTNKVNALNELSKLLARSDIKKAEAYAQEALYLAQKNGFEKGEAQALTALGVINFMSGKLDSSFNAHSRALEIREKIGDKKGIGTSWSNIGILHQGRSNFPSAMEALLKSLKIREEIKDEQGVLSSLNNLAALYMGQANEQNQKGEIYQKALEYLEKALPLARKLKNKQNEAVLLNNIGSVHEILRDFNGAIEYYQKAIKIREAIHDNYQLTTSYQSLGDAYLGLNQLDKAMDFYLKGQKMGNMSQNRLVVGQCLFGMAQVYEKREEYLTSLQHAEDALSIAQQVQEKSHIIKIKTLLARVYAKQGNFAKAYNLKTEATALKDSIFNAENSRIIANAKEAAEKERNERLQKDIELKDKTQKEKDARQALVNYSVTGVIIFIIGIAFLLYRGQQREKKHSQEMETEKDKSEALLLNILPKEVADELKAEGKARAKHYNLASVLFTDFQGFTARTAAMTPEQVIEELNGCFSAFDAIIEKHGLEKIKTIGDAYMCAGGLPIPNNTNPVDIIRAGLEMQTYMQQYKEACIARGEAFFQCRLGINTGEVVAGVVGTKKFAYDIWGDTVNTASRAESNGVVNMVNITEATYQYVKDVFECEYRGEIEAKGKGKIGMYLVLGEKKPTISTENA